MSFSYVPFSRALAVFAYGNRLLAGNSKSRLPKTDISTCWFPLVGLCLATVPNGYYAFVSMSSAYAI